MVCDELVSSDEMPTRIVYKALNESCASAVEHERKRNQKIPTWSHFSLPGEFHVDIARATQRWSSAAARKERSDECDVGWNDWLGGARISVSH